MWTFTATAFQVPASRITILCYYRAQVDAVQRLTPGTDLRELSVSTVDNYQGDEQDAIILSTVRNNEAAPFKTGFLRSRSRSCVACSRAKRCLFVLGHASLLRSANDHWKGVLDAIESDNGDAPSDGLKLINRENEIINVRTTRDVQALEKS